MKAVTKRLGAVILALAIALSFMPALPVYAAGGDVNWNIEPIYVFDFTKEKLSDNSAGILFNTTAERQRYEIQKDLLDTLVSEESIQNLGTSAKPLYDVNGDGEWDFDIVNYSNEKFAFRANPHGKIYSLSGPHPVPTNYFHDHADEALPRVDDVFFYFAAEDIKENRTIKFDTVWYTGGDRKPGFKVINKAYKDPKTGEYEVLTKGKDYEIDSWYNNSEAGEGTLIIKGINRYWNTMEATFTIKKRSLTYKKISYKVIPGYTWNGKAKKPVVKATYNGMPLQKGQDYSIQYKYNVNVGQAKVILKGKGNYTGTKTLYFNIKPKGTSITKLTGDKGSFTVKWNKRTEKMSKSRITGYQIQYSKKSDFSTKSSVKVPLKDTNGNYRVSKKVKGLKKGKYYVRIRTYKKISSSSGTKTYYSSWKTYKSPVTVK